MALTPNLTGVFDLDSLPQPVVASSLVSDSSHSAFVAASFSDGTPLSADQLATFSASTFGRLHLRIRLVRDAQRRSQALFSN